MTISGELATPDPESAARPASIQRIRESALTTFAVRGIETTSLRVIANGAGVSIGLVQHHFGTKGNLIRAVDEYVLTVLAETLAAPLASAPGDPVADAAARVMSLMTDHTEVVDYLCRALAENSPIGVRIFDNLVEICTGYWAQIREQGLTQPGLDPLWITLSPLTLVLGTFMLRSHLSRHLPEALVTPMQLARWRDATETIIGRGQLQMPDQGNQAS